MKTFFQFCTYCTISVTDDSGNESATTTATTTTLTGDSGEQYEFEVYALDAKLDAGGAVYAVARQKGDRHVPLYFGQTKDVSVRLHGHHKSECFDENEADCLCVHREDDEDSRLKKELDLMIRYHPVCNGPQ